MTDSEHRPPRLTLRGRTGVAVAAGAALLAVGGGVGAIAVRAMQPAVAMAPSAPTAIRALQSGGIITIKGQVAEIYGNKFVMQDASGRALVETGRQGEDGTLVTVGEPVTVQGRFDRGFVRAAFLVGPDNKVLALGPLNPPDGPGRRGPGHGPRDDRGPPPPPPPPGGGREAPAPVPPAAAAANADAAAKPS